LIIATAGHVDHGKTSLIRQLTGVDTDRLEEEKRRGLSINLGFAYLPQDNGTRLGFIDVPGHTRFINTMISGVSGIDLGMLVVAADDGPMPQTLEHLDVLRLLGLRDFVAVISKTDRVPAERVEEVSAKVRRLLENEKYDLFTVSNITGKGIPELLAFLQGHALRHKTRGVAGNFRMSIDRAFLLKGIGLVVTGTATAGKITVGDALQLLPQRTTLRVRSLRVHDQEAQSGHAGQRCALNITGNIEKQQITRGDVLTAATNAPLKHRFDARFRLLPNGPFPVKHLSPVKLHIGAKHLEARLYIIDEIAGSRLQPGAEALVQIITALPLSCCRGDRFLLRDHSETVTLGGGLVLDPLAPRAGKSREHRLTYLAAMSNDDVEQSLRQLLDTQRNEINLSDFSRSWNLHEQEMLALRDRVAAMHFVQEDISYVIAMEHWQTAGKSLLKAVQQLHLKHPEKPGIKLSALLSHLEDVMSSTLFRAVLSQAMQETTLSLVGGLVQTSGYKPRESRVDQQCWQTLEKIFETQAAQMPLVSELMKITTWSKPKVLDTLNSAQRQGLVLKLNDRRYGLPRQLLDYAKKVLTLEANGEEINVTNYRDSTGVGRNLIIELLEYFDSIRFTQRRGGHRVILDPTLPDKHFTR